ncbi:MAG: hypothetical protein IBJ03_18650 [Gemmatimonadaceae bacterium]|nr:hypothetical protein [Gemmatimonadaceae bacterium]
MNVTRNDDGQSPGADPRVTDALRSHYAAPQDEAYWQHMESRLMQRITASISGAVLELKPAWWSGFGEFRRADWQKSGLIAATIALMAAGATFVREQRAVAQAREMAARAAVEAAMPLPIDDGTLSRRDRLTLSPDAPERYLNLLDSY